MGSSRMHGLIRSEGEGRRSAELQHCVLSAQLRSALASYTVQVCELSSIGARVAAERLPEPGMIVCLQRGAVAVFGTMAWADEGQGGIFFDEELDAQLFARAPIEAAQPEGEDPNTIAQAKLRLARVRNSEAPKRRH